MYFEYAVKNVWPLVRDAKPLRRYLPAKEMDAGIYPDKEFFWNSACPIIPNWQ